MHRSLTRPRRRCRQMRDHSYNNWVVHIRVRELWPRWNTLRPLKHRHVRIHSHTHTCVYGVEINSSLLFGNELAWRQLQWNHIFTRKTPKGRTSHLPDYNHHLASLGSDSYGRWHAGLILTFTVLCRWSRERERERDKWRKIYMTECDRSV